jgi:hypothetical protein
VVYTGSLPQGWIQDVIPYGDNVYFLDVGKNLTRQMRYDIKNKTVTRIINDDDNLAPHITGFFNNKLLFNIYDGDDNYEKKWKVYSSDLDGSKIKELPIDINFISNIYSFGDYIFVRPVSSHLQLMKNIVIFLMRWWYTIQTIKKLIKLICRTIRNHLFWSLVMINTCLYLTGKMVNII